MASTNNAAALKVVIEKSGSGDQIKTHDYANTGPVAAGGSPDGVLANQTADKQLIAPASRRGTAEGDDFVRLFYKGDAADGLDASDATILVAVTEDTGSEYQLTSSDFGYTTDYPAATPADQWIEIGSGFQVPKGRRLLMGSASLKMPTVISIENDTA